eukprot:GFKZ01007642.1.p3 GENE.GFKZ01007642.1~~GFKZ01007642.1.p3  ORF type:complete len:118 (+),score=7.93 GFKZ01007642.1:1209-1562(+)
MPPPPPATTAGTTPANRPLPTLHPYAPDAASTTPNTTVVFSHQARTKRPTASVLVTPPSRPRSGSDAIRPDATLQSPGSKDAILNSPGGSPAAAERLCLGAPPTAAVQNDDEVYSTS